MVHIIAFFTLLEDLRSPADPHTYALVMFAKDEAISVVPRKKIVESDPAAVMYC